MRCGGYNRPSIPVRGCSLVECGRLNRWDAGRRSAGLGSKGGTQAHTHAVGVRAYGAVCVPQTGCGDVGDGAIWTVVGHRRCFDGAKIRKFGYAGRANWAVHHKVKIWSETTLPVFRKRAAPGMIVFLLYIKTDRIYPSKYFFVKTLAIPIFFFINNITSPRRF